MAQFRTRHFVLLSVTLPFVCAATLVVSGG